MRRSSQQPGKDDLTFAVLPRSSWSCFVRPGPPKPERSRKGKRRIRNLRIRSQGKYDQSSAVFSHFRKPRSKPFDLSQFVSRSREILADANLP
jgi:hypothetical protein